MSVNVNQRARQRAGTVVAAVLGVDAVFHLYWTTGARWPASDTRSLSQAVVGLDVAFGPRVLVPLVVLLTSGAALMLARVGQLGEVGRRLPGWAPQVGALAIGGGLLARGLTGVVIVATGHDSTVFYRLNVALYTPLCLALALAALAASTAPRPRPERSGVAQLGIPEVSNARPNGY